MSFEGVVKDKSTGIELEKALVVVRPKRISGGGFYSGVLTEPDGKFKISTSHKYFLEIIVTKKGCTRKVIKVKKGEIYYDIIIECEAETIEQILIEKSSDSDNDGVLDSVDKCIDLAGDKENEGCPWPDNDNDGLSNKDDVCPEEPGTVEDKGCPAADADSDGIVDKDDACPNEAGTSASLGCPSNPKSMIDFITKEDSIILFSVNSSVQNSSYDTLINQISNLLKKYPNISLQIAGHASSDGSATFNQTLSRERATNVKKALVQLGIDSSRLKDIGFGEENPPQSNKTVAGRSQNRSVLFSIE